MVGDSCNDAVGRDGGGAGSGTVGTDRSEVALGSDPRAGRVGSGVLFLPSCLRVDRSIGLKNASVSGSEMRILFVACSADAV